MTQRSSFLMREEIRRHLRTGHVALLLLIELRGRYYGTGQEFTLRPRDIKQMGFAHLSRRRFREARDYLIANGKLAVVHRGGSGRGDASTYKLIDPPDAPDPDDLIEDDPDDVFEDDDDAEDDADHHADDGIPF